MVNALKFEIADGSEAPVKLADNAHRPAVVVALAAGHRDRHPPLVLYARPSGCAGNTHPASHPRRGRDQVRDGHRPRSRPDRRCGWAQVRFTGNTHTHDATLRRLVRSKPGELLNPDQVQRQPGADFAARRLSQRRSPLRSAGRDTRDVVYDLTEGRRQEVNLLAGYGSYEQLRGGVEWRHYNLFGRAHTDSLKLIESMKSS